MRINKINKFEKYFAEFQDKVFLFNHLAGNDDKPKEELIPLYFKLLAEEAEEMRYAKSAEDEIDSIIDQLVVGMYLAKLLGAEVTYLSFHYSDGDDDYKILSDNISYMCEQGEWSEVDFDELMKCFLQLDVDHKGALMEVANSNLSKYIPVQGGLSDLQMRDFDAECVAIEAQGRYSGVVWNRVGDHIVFTDKNGKIMKPSTFWEPNLAQYIY